MEYQKIINVLDNKTNQTPKYRTKTWVKINDKTKTGSFDVPDQIKFNCKDKVKFMWLYWCINTC